MMAYFNIVSRKRCFKKEQVPGFADASPHVYHGQFTVSVSISGKIYVQH